MAETENQGDGAGQPAAVIAERHRNPEATVARSPSTKYVFSGICAILATLAFVAILVVLWVDWTALQAA